MPRLNSYNNPKKKGFNWDSVPRQRLGSSLAELGINADIAFLKSLLQQEAERAPNDPMKQRPIYWETLNKITELHRYSFCPIPRESVFQINKGQIVHKRDKNRQKEREKGKAKNGAGDATEEEDLQTPRADQYGSGGVAWNSEKTNREIAGIENAMRDQIVLMARNYTAHCTSIKNLTTHTQQLSTSTKPIMPNIFGKCQDTEERTKIAWCKSRLSKEVEKEIREEMERDRQRKEIERLAEEEEEGRRRAQEEQERAAQAETEDELPEDSKEDSCSGSDNSSEGGPPRLGTDSSEANSPFPSDYTKSGDEQEVQNKDEQMKDAATSLEPETRGEDKNENREEVKEEVKAEAAEVKPEEPPIFSLPTPNVLRHPYSVSTIPIEDLESRSDLEEDLAQATLTQMDSKEEL